MAKQIVVVAGERYVAEVVEGGIKDALFVGGGLNSQLTPKQVAEYVQEENLGELVTVEFNDVGTAVSKRALKPEENIMFQTASFQMELAKVKAIKALENTFFGTAFLGN